MDATANTTESKEATERAPRPKPAADASRPSFKGPAVLAGLLACALLGLGGPRLAAALSALEAGGTVDEVLDGRPVAAERLTAAAAGLAAAGHRVVSGETEGDRGFLLMHQALARAPGEERTRLLKEATEATRRALAAAPGQPSLWARLAYLHESQGGTAEAVKALRLSMLSGAVVPPLMVSRIELGLRLLPALDQETLALLHRQIRLTWIIDPQFVTGLGTHPEFGSLVRTALADLSEEEMKQYLRHHGGRSSGAG